MSFVKDGITFYEPSDFSLVVPSAIDGVLAYSGNYIRRVAKESLLAHQHDRIDNLAGNYVDVSSQCVLQSMLSMFLTAMAGPIFIDSRYGGYSIYLKAPVDSYVATWPPGNNISIFASAFVEWSSAALKDNIADIPDAPGIVALMKGEAYTIGNKSKTGFVVESNPPEVISSAIDKDGKETEGVNLSSILAHLVEAVKALTSRVTELEKGVK